MIGVSDSTAAKISLLQSDETLATVIHAILRDKYGEEVYSWEPLTVALEVKDDFGVDMATGVMDKWCAMQVVMGSDAFFKRLDAFLAVCNSLAEGVPFFDEFNPVTVEEAAWAIAEVGMNRDMLPFSYPIRAYLKLMLKSEGFNDDTFPPIFKEVFEKEPSAADVRAGVAALGNNNNIGAYIKDQIRDLAAQFNSIPDMSKVDDEILHTGLLKALNQKD